MIRNIIVDSSDRRTPPVEVNLIKKKTWFAPVLMALSEELEIKGGAGGSAEGTSGLWES